MYMRVSFNIIYVATAIALCSIAHGTAPSPYTQHRGPCVTNGGVSFRVWAPHATSVAVAGTFNSWNMSSDMLAHDSGNTNYWSIFLTTVNAGDEYKFVINGSEWKSDPWSRELGNNLNSIVKAEPSGWTPFTRPDDAETVLYELHIGSFNGGDFSSVAEKAAYLKSLGINAVELMPPAHFGTAESWGYNPIAPFAPAAQYGGYDACAAMIDALHAQDIAVYIDVVYNHIEGPVLWKWDGWSQGSHTCAIDGQTVEHGGIFYYDWTDEKWYTPWGHNRPNYSEYAVTNYITDNVWFWLEEMNCDGMRWDSTFYMRQVEPGWGDIVETEPFLSAVNAEADSRQSSAILVAEDLARWDAITQKSRFGFDSQWDDYFVDTVRAEMKKTSDSDRDINALMYAVQGVDNGRTWARVKFTESHDDAGNGQSRLNVEIDPGSDGTSWYAKKRSTLGAALALTSPGIPMLFMGQEFLETGWFDMDPDPLDWSKVTTYGGIWRLYRDMIHLRRNIQGISGGLKGDNVNVYFTDTTRKMAAYHRYSAGGVNDDVVVIVNAQNTTQSGVEIGMPAAGDWNCILNSDWKCYDASYSHIGNQILTAGGAGLHGMPARATCTIAPYSVLIYSRAAVAAPVPGFSASPTDGPTGLTVSFLDDTTGVGTNWVWQFGDGAESSVINPVHTYADPGDYTVTLTVYGPGGVAEYARTNYISVYGTDWVDGQNILSDFASADAASYQNTTTDWGAWNSLLSLHGRLTANYLELAVAGSVEAASGNGIVLFFDMDSGSGYTTIPSNLSGVAWRISNMAGLQFDNDFTPEYALNISLEQNTTPQNAWVDFSDLVADSHQYWGQMTGLGTSFGEVSNNGARVALYNQNAAGTDVSATNSFSTGLEMKIPYSTIGGFTDGCKVQALIFSQDGSYSANQSLSPINGATNAYAASGMSSEKDYSRVPGQQYLLIGVPEPGGIFMLSLCTVYILRCKRGVRV